MTHGNLIKVLVTGFGPFPGIRSNPSGKLVEWTDAGRYPARDNIEISTAIIPTSWDAVEAYSNNNLHELNADIALHFGVSTRARGFQVEKIARNTVTTAPDCNGKRFRGSCIEPHEPATLHTRVAAEPLACKLRKRGLPATVSQDAGRYLCNMLLYRSLKNAMGRSSPCICTFIHIPPLQTGYLDKADLLTGLHIIVTHCAGLHRRAIQRRNGKSG